MGYLNPFEKMGYEHFAKAAHAAGIDGVLVVDLPPEEAHDKWLPLLHQYQLDPIFLIAPTTTTERISIILQAAKGYLYYISLKGVTGATNINVKTVTTPLAAIRKQTSLPIAVGFGIHNAETAIEAAQFADGIIIGSALVNYLITSSIQQPASLTLQATEWLQQIRTALDNYSYSV
jgi:tryptophan synthase alpha chain